MYLAVAVDAELLDTLALDAPSVSLAYTHLEATFCTLSFVVSCVCTVWLTASVCLHVGLPDWLSCGRCV